MEIPQFTKVTYTAVRGVHTVVGHRGREHYIVEAEEGSTVGWTHDKFSPEDKRVCPGYTPNPARRYFYAHANSLTVVEQELTYPFF